MSTILSSWRQSSLGALAQSANEEIVGAIGVCRRTRQSRFGPHPSVGSLLTASGEP